MRGDRLKQSRELHQLSQEDLGQRTGLSKQQIYRYETEMNDPSAEVLARLAKELQVSADWLLGLVDKPDDHLTEEDLSPMERLLIASVRRGQIYEALDRVTALTKENDQPNVPPDQPAVDSHTLQSGQSPVPSNKRK